VNQFPARLTINPTALGDKVHEAEEKDGNGKREEGGEVGRHGWLFSLEAEPTKGKSILEDLFQGIFDSLAL